MPSWQRSRNVSLKPAHSRQHPVFDVCRQNDSKCESSAWKSVCVQCQLLSPGFISSFFFVCLSFLFLFLFLKFFNPNETLLAIYAGLLFSITTRLLQPVQQHTSGHIFVTLTQQHQVCCRLWDLDLLDYHRQTERWWHLLLMQRIKFTHRLLK